MLNIDKLYKMSKEDPENKYPLLTNFSSNEDVDWWSEYVTNFEVFDFQFRQQFKSFVFFDQDHDDTDDDIMEKWQATIFSWLAMNDKRYSELYRIHVIPDDEAYALTNNYDLHETYSGTNAAQGASTTGQRTDVTIDEMGSQNSSNLDKVTGWNSGSENTRDSSTSAVGTREDTHQFTKGQETDTSRTQGQDAHTLRRWGNIGVMTVDDLLKKHSDLWQVFNFYKIVFDDICKNFLMIGRDVSIWH